MPQTWYSKAGADAAFATPISVAAATATKVDKANVAINVMDYGAVGDGTADDSAALAAALAAGKDVLIPQGKTFLVSNVQVNGRRISGPGTIKKAAAAQSALHLIGEGSIVDGVTFDAEASSGQPITDIKLGDGAKNVLVTGCLFRSPHYSAVMAAPEGIPYTTRVSGVQITSNRFVANPVSSSYARPVFLHSVDNALIDGNLFRDTRFDAVRLRENSGYVQVVNNQFINIGDPSWPDTQTRDAVDTYYSGAQLVIANNVVRKTASIGFDVKGYAPDGTGTNRVIITGNQISGCRFSGIKLFGDSNYDGASSFKFLAGAIVSNNIVWGCNLNNATGTGSVSDSGILIDGLVSHANITGNHVSECRGRGIYAHNNSPSQAMANNILIAQNIVVNNGDGVAACAGIHAVGVDYCTIESNTVLNDTTIGNAGAQTIGIYVNNTDNGYTTTARSMAITGNRVRGHSGAQIQADPSNNRATGIGVFRENQTSAVYRGTWMDSRLTTYGSAAPTSAEGAFVRGDRVFATAPAVEGTAGSQYVTTGWICTLGGSPGTWVEMRALTGT